ncbi:hypothetical protein [uncultured Paracoccus sp.]|uniref:hypothetical protein n=1 Tax=uncultured Paracoccus sp. TaxID=189685 RepID=UPI00262ADBDF|nr:hypothetical protein [uncultured Paracoccus sp.]
MSAALQEDGLQLVFERAADPYSSWWQRPFHYDMETGVGAPILVPEDAWVEDFALSPDGSTVAFSSRYNLLGLEDHDGYTSHVYLYDMATATMRSITVDSEFSNHTPMFSADGSTLVFTENPGIWDENAPRPDVIVHDLESGTNTNITDVGNGGYYHWAMEVSNDGSKVVYRQETNPHPWLWDDSDPFIVDSDLFVHDRTTGESIKIADGHHTQEGVGVRVESAGFIDDNSKLVFTRGEGSGIESDVLIFDLETGTTTTIGHGAGHVSAHGSTIVYTTAGITVGSGQNNLYGRFGDVFAYDLKTGITTSITEGSDGGIAGLRLSADESKVIFSSNATNLIDGEVDLNGDTSDVFIFDMESGALANITSGGNGDSFVGGISADGSRAIFTSHATNLVEGVIDTNGNQLDVFVFEI